MFVMEILLQNRVSIELYISTSTSHDTINSRSLISFFAIQFLSGLLFSFRPSASKKKKKINDHDENESQPKCSLDLPIPLPKKESKTKCSMDLPIVESQATKSPMGLKLKKPTPNIITYALSPTNTIDYIDLPLIETAIKRAFECYACVIPVFFLRVADYLTADVKIGFFSGDHDGCSHPFTTDNPLLAHAWQDGGIHINTAYRWSVDFKKETASMAMHLESMLVHEIGHVLGLHHSSLEAAVMYPILDARTTKVNLAAVDVEMVQAIYGTNFDMIEKHDWRVLTVGAYFDGRSAGGGFILWDGDRRLTLAQSFPLNCGSAASARFQACWLGLNFLKMHGIDRVLVLTSCINFRQILRFTGDALRTWLDRQMSVIKFQSRYSEGIQATAQLAKMGRRSKQVSQMDQKNWPEPMLGLLNRESRMLRHLPLDAFS